VRFFKPNRLLGALLAGGLILPTLAPCARAQDDNQPSLGEVARNLRKKAAAASQPVIDNDNLSKVMDEAEKQRSAGSTVFALAPAMRSFQISSPDVTCSLSFSSKAMTEQLMLDELPRSELAKLDGPASIDGDSLEISMHNGTAWELHEVVIGLTLVRQRETSSRFGQARIVPASAAPPQDSAQKQPDVTMLLRAKGVAAPAATAIFRTTLNFALFPDQEWHWAVVKARGIPPQDSAGTPLPSEPVPQNQR